MSKPWKSRTLFNYVALREQYSTSDFIRKSIIKGNEHFVTLVAIFLVISVASKTVVSDESS